MASRVDRGRGWVIYPARPGRGVRTRSLTVEACRARGEGGQAGARARGAGRESRAGGGPRRHPR